MDFLSRRLDNAVDNISVSVYAVYTPEEREALTRCNAWEIPAIDRICADLGAWRGGLDFVNPTYRQLDNPGILFRGFVAEYADSFQNGLDAYVGYAIRQNLGYVLERFRAGVHQYLELQRDGYHGVPRALPSLSDAGAIPYTNDPVWIRRGR